MAEKRAGSFRYPSQVLADQQRSKTRVNIGSAFSRWCQLKDAKGLKSHAKVATFLLDSYSGTKSEDRPELSTLERSSSTESCESLDYECPSSPNEGEQETDAAPPVRSPDSGKVDVTLKHPSYRSETESGRKDAASQRLKSQDESTTTNQSERSENGDIQEVDDEEFSFSLSVGDGRHLVDLGSSSEFVVDEECILQLFRSCWECSRQCSVRKQVKGLKLVVYQTCCFCQSHRKWTNLPDEDDDFQTNGKDAAHGLTASVISEMRLQADGGFTEIT